MSINLKPLLSCDDIDNRHDVGDINLLVLVHVGIAVGGSPCYLVDHCHDVADVHFLVLVHVALQMTTFALVNDFDGVGIKRIDHGIGITNLAVILGLPREERFVAVRRLKSVNAVLLTVLIVELGQCNLAARFLEGKSTWIELVVRHLEVLGVGSRQVDYGSRRSLNQVALGVIHTALAGGRYLRLDDHVGLRRRSGTERIHLTTLLVQVGQRHGVVCSNLAFAVEELRERGSRPFMRRVQERLQTA